jgi:hypothetical protein
MSSIGSKGRLALGSLVVAMHLMFFIGWPTSSTRQPLQETNNRPIAWLQLQTNRPTQRENPGGIQWSSTRDSNSEAESLRELKSRASSVRGTSEDHKRITSASAGIEGNSSYAAQTTGLPADPVDEHSFGQASVGTASTQDEGVTGAPSALSLTLPKNWSAVAPDLAVRRAMEDHRSNTPKLTAWDRLEKAVGVAPCFLLRPDENGNPRKVIGKRKAVPRLYSESTRDDRPVYVCVEQ